MEIHRLTPMKENYPVKLFNQLYKDTKALRKKLARQVDSRRYGVSPDIIESWFDDKFIFVFNKHWENKDPDVLKGFIISALQTYKLRILRGAYSKAGEYYSSLVDLEGESNLINIIPDESTMDTHSVFSNMVREFMKERLSDDAYTVFQIQLDPPPYILNRISKSNSHIPNDLMADFLGFEHSNKTKKYISRLRKEITLQTEIAKEYFNNTSLAIS